MRNRPLFLKLEVIAGMPAWHEAIPFMRGETL